MIEYMPCTSHRLQGNVVYLCFITCDNNLIFDVETLVKLMDDGYACENRTLKVCDNNNPTWHMYHCFTFSYMANVELYGRTTKYLSRAIHSIISRGNWYNRWIAVLYIVSVEWFIHKASSSRFDKQCSIYLAHQRELVIDFGNLGSSRSTIHYWRIQITLVSSFKYTIGNLFNELNMQVRFV
jgi:hypothetical protein